MSYRSGTSRSLYQSARGELIELVSHEPVGGENFGNLFGHPRQYDDLDKRLAVGPVITVPTITLEGDANGAPHPPSSAYAKKFSGKHAHRVINGEIGHNLPQEAPQAFAKAIMDVDSL